MRARIVFAVVALVLCLLIAACGESSDPATTESINPVDSAAAQATAIVQQAKATALVLEAQIQATALVEQARMAGGTPTSAVEIPVVYLSPTPAPPGVTPISGQTSPVATAVNATVIIEVTGVSFAAEGGMIMVSFLAPPEEAEKWWPGTVSVTDEEAGTVYNEIPVMPKIGPLIGRPKVAGQPGYVMLTNAPPYLQPGARVTVVLGAHTFEHIVVH